MVRRWTWAMNIKTFWYSSPYSLPAMRLGRQTIDSSTKFITGDDFRLWILSSQGEPNLKLAFKSNLAQQHQNIALQRDVLMLLGLFWTSKIHKSMKANEELEKNETPPFGIYFWINESKNYTKSEGWDVVKYIDLLVWILEVRD